MLRRLGMMNSDNVVEVKGRVACEVDSADELVITELIFNNSFSDLSVEQCVALCSCFVYGEKANDEAAAGFEEVLTTPLRMLRESMTQPAQRSSLPRTAIPGLSLIENRCG